MGGVSHTLAPTGRSSVCESTKHAVQPIHTYAHTLSLTASGRAHQHPSRHRHRHCEHSSERRTLTDMSHVAKRSAVAPPRVAPLLSPHRRGHLRLHLLWECGTECWWAQRSVRDHAAGFEGEDEPMLLRCVVPRRVGLRPSPSSPPRARHTLVAGCNSPTSLRPISSRPHPSCAAPRDACRSPADRAASARSDGACARS